jgi:DNA repair exonuclease SbcCD ATPase subunit
MENSLEAKQPYLFGNFKIPEIGGSNGPISKDPQTTYNKFDPNFIYKIPIIIKYELPQQLSEPVKKTRKSIADGKRLYKQVQRKKKFLEDENKTKDKEEKQEETHKRHVSEIEKVLTRLEETRKRSITEIDEARKILKEEEKGLIEEQKRSKKEQKRLKIAQQRLEDTRLKLQDEKTGKGYFL